MIRFTPEYHPEYEELVAAAQKIKKINDDVNEGKRRTENRKGVFLLASKLQEAPPDIVFFFTSFLQSKLGPNANFSSPRLSSNHTENY